MKILIDMGHPGNVLFYLNAINELKDRGHETLVTARYKEVAFKLLEAYGIPYVNRGGFQRGLARKAAGLLATDMRLFSIARSFKPDVLTGFHNPYIAQTAFLAGKPSVIFTDTEHAALSSILAFPFATRVCTPAWFKKDLGRKHVRFNGFKEQAYLQPKYFKPDPAALNRAGIDPKQPYAIIRLVSWQATHDIGQRGITGLEELIAEVGKSCRVLLTSEARLSPELEKYQLRSRPEDLQSILYYACLQVGEGSTTAAEAGLLGTPSVYVSTLVGTMGNFDELARRELVFSYRTLPEAMPKIRDILADGRSKEMWRTRSEKAMDESCDVTAFIVDQLESVAA